MLEVKQLQKSFSGFQLGPLDFTLQAGKHLVLLGPSGSGKSLILELISGFQRADGGSISINGRDITHLQVQQRKLGFIFQHTALFPHISVAANMAYPLKSINVRGGAAKKKVNELAERFSVSHLLHRRPGSLSGGELQRVSIARALAMEPDLLLLDEPLSSLDVQMRSNLREVLHQLKQEGLTMLHVTHDFEEAIRLADQVGIMQQGKLVQNDTADRVFREPASGFVAHLTGLRNYFEASLDDKQPDELRSARIGQIEIKLYSKSNARKGLVLINEDQITLLNSMPETSAQNQLRARIKSIRKLPVGSEVVVDAGILLHVKLTDESVQSMNLSEGKSLIVSFKASAVRFLSL